MVDFRDLLVWNICGPGVNEKHNDISLCTQVDSQCRYLHGTLHRDPSSILRTHECATMHVVPKALCTGVHRSQKRAPNPWRYLHSALSHKQVLGHELASFGRATSAPHCWAFFPARPMEALWQTVPSIACALRSRYSSSRCQLACWTHRARS